MAVVTFDYYSTQLAALDAAAPRNFEDGVIMGGKVRLKLAEYIIPVGGVAVSKRIELARLAAGCRILPESLVLTEDMGASTTLSIGYNQIVGATSGDATFAAATACSTLGTKIPFVTTVTTVGLALGDKLLQDTSIHVLTAGGSFTAGKRIKLFLYHIPVID